MKIGDVGSPKGYLRCLRITGWKNLPEDVCYTSTGESFNKTDLFVYGNNNVPQLRQAENYSSQLKRTKFSTWKIKLLNLKELIFPT